MKPSSIPSGHRYCRACDHTKPEDQFYRRSTGNTAFQAYCIPCTSAKATRWFADHKESKTKRDADYYAKNRMAKLEVARQRRANRTPEQRNADRLKARMRRQNRSAEQLAKNKQYQKEWHAKASKGSANVVLLVLPLYRQGRGTSDRSPRPERVYL